MKRVTFPIQKQKLGKCGAFCCENYAFSISYMLPGLVIKLEGNYLCHVFVTPFSVSLYHNSLMSSMSMFFFLLFFIYILASDLVLEFLLPASP